MAEQRDAVGAGKLHGGLFRTAGIGGGAFVLGVVVGVVISVALGLSTDEGPLEIGGVAGPNKDDVHVPLVVGAVGEIAPERSGEQKARVTILAIEENPQPTGESRFNNGEKAWAMQVEIQNVGTQKMPALQWTLRDSNDNEVNRVLVSGQTLVGVGDPLVGDFNLAPGGKRSGWLTFFFDADATVKWIRADPNSRLNNDLYFDPVRE